MTYIYESPNSGKTVYRRKLGTDQKELVKDETGTEIEVTNQWIMWRDILRSAKTNPALKEALDRAQIIYELSRREV